MFIAYVYKLRPNRTQQQTIERWLDMLKSQYNFWLAERIEAYEQVRSPKLGEYCDINTQGIAARLADVKDSSILRAFESAAQKPSGLAEFLIQNGFDGAAQNDWRSCGIPDLALALILEYYAYEAQERHRKEQAKAACRVFRAIGLRDWMRQLAGCTEQASLSNNTIQSLATEAVQIENLELKQEIDRIVEEWLKFIPKLVRLTDHCFGLIGRQGEDQKIRLINRIDKGVSHEEL